MATHSHIMGPTLDLNLTYITHIHNISIEAHKPQQMRKTLTATGWGKQKEKLMATYKAVMIPALEYASSIIMAASCILEQHQQTASHTQCSIANCHMMHTRHKHTASSGPGPLGTPGYN